MRTVGLGAHRPERGLHLDRGSLYKVHGLQQLHQLFVQNDGRYHDVPYVYRMMGVIVVTTTRLYRQKLIVHETPHDVPRVALNK